MRKEPDTELQKQEIRGSVGVVASRDASWPLEGDVEVMLAGTRHSSFICVKLEKPNGAFGEPKKK